MPREFASLLLAIWTVPLAAGVYIVTFDVTLAVTNWSAIWMPSIVAGGVAWMVLALGFALGFRLMVVVTPRKLVWTALSGVGLALLGGASSVWAYLLTSNEYHAADIARHASWLVPLCWAGAQITIWREPATDRLKRLAGAGAYRIACPGCGYDLSTCTSAHCSECGRQYSLAHLIVLQPGQRVTCIRAASDSLAARAIDQNGASGDENRK